MAPGCLKQPLRKISSQTVQVIFEGRDLLQPTRRLVNTLLSTFFPNCMFCKTYSNIVVRTASLNTSLFWTDYSLNQCLTYSYLFSMMSSPHQLGIVICHVHVQCVDNVAPLGLQHVYSQHALPFCLGLFPVLPIFA